MIQISSFVWGSCPSIHANRENIRKTLQGQSATTKYSKQSTLALCTASSLVGDKRMAFMHSTAQHLETPIFLFAHQPWCVSCSDLWLRFGEIHKLQGTQAEHGRLAWKSQWFVSHVPNDMSTANLIEISAMFPNLILVLLLGIFRLHWFPFAKNKDFLNFQKSQFRFVSTFAISSKAWPVPLCDWTMTSRPCRIGRTARCCTADGLGC